MVKNVGVKALRKIISLISALSIALSQTLIGTAYVGTAYASDNNVQFNNAVRATGQLLINGLNKHSTKFGLQWVEGEFGYSKKNKFEFGLTSFSVFKETSNTVFISQNSISKKYAGTTVNLGLGIRKLVSLNGTDKAIIGLNAFYDFRDGTSGIFDFAGGIHKRYSVGLELKTSKFDTFANSYKKISNAIGGEQVLSGYDFGVSGKIPNYENFSLSATHYNFTGDVKSLKGNKFGLEYKPNAVFTTGIEYDKSHTQDSSLNVFVNVELALDKPFDEQLSEIVGNSSNVWDKRYDKIKRDNVMHIEEVDITNSMVISVANISVIEGNRKVFTVNLNKKIALDKNIIIGVKSTDLGVATVGGVKDLTFTSTTWNEPQKVTVTGVNNDGSTDDRSAKIQLTIEKSSTDDVVGMSPVEINVVVQDVMKSKPAKPEVNSVTGFWSMPIFVTTIVGQIYEIHETVGNGMSYDEGTGRISATKPGTAKVRTRRTATDTDRESVWSDYTLVTFTAKGASTGEITKIVAPTVPWGTDIRIEGKISQKYEVVPGTANPGITYNSGTGVVKATQPGTITIRTQLLATVTEKASDWVSTKLTFEKQEQKIITGDQSGGIWTSNFELSNVVKSNEDDAKGEWSYVIVDVDGHHMGGGLLTSLLHATGPGIVRVKITRAADNKYKEAMKIITVTFADKNASIGNATKLAAKTATWGTPITIIKIDGQDYEPIVETVGAGITYNETTGIVEATQSGTLYMQTRLATTATKKAGDWVSTQFTFTKQTQDITTNANQSGGSFDSGFDLSAVVQSNRGDKASGEWSYTLRGGNAPNRGVTNKGIVSAQGPGTVTVRVTRVADNKYAEVGKEIMVTFEKAVAKGNATKLAAKTATWGTPITIIKIDGQDYEPIVETVGAGITYNETTGIVEATQSGTLYMQTRIMETATEKAGDWVPTQFTFTRQTQDITTNENQVGGFWGTDFDLSAVVKSNRGNKASGKWSYILRHEDAPSGGVTDEGIVSAQGPGTVIVAVYREEDDKYAEVEKDITVTFTETDRSGDQAVAPTVNNKIASWVETITVTRIDGQEYELTNASTGITYNKSTGIVAATQSGTANVRTKVLAKNGQSDGAWSPSTILTFTTQTQDITTNENQSGGSFDSGFDLSAVVQSNRGDKASGEWSYTLRGGNAPNRGVTNKGIVSAQGPGTVTVRVTRVADNKYAEVGKEIMVTFEKAVAKGNATKLAAKTATWGTPITIIKIDGQDYEPIVETVGAGITYNETTGIVEATQSGTLYMQTRIMETATEKAGDWVPTQFTFTRQTQDITTNENQVGGFWGTDFDLSAVVKSNRGNKASGKWSYILRHEDAPSGGVTDEGIVSAQGPGTVIVAVYREEDDKYAEVEKDITVTFTETDRSGDQAVAPTVNNKIASWVETITVTRIDGQEYELTNASTGITYNKSTGIVAATQSGTANVRTKVLAKNGQSDGAWSPSTILTFTTQTQDITTNENQSGGSFDSGFDLSAVVQSNRGDKASGEWSYTLRGGNAPNRGVTNKGIVSAQGPGTVQVKIIREADDKYASAEKIITVTFTKKVAKGNAQAIAESSATWGTPITIKKIATQDYEAIDKTASTGITHVPGTGVVKATQSGTITMRTRIATTDTEKASDWVSTKLTFKRQEQEITTYENQSDGAWDSNFDLSNVLRSNKGDAMGDWSYALVSGGDAKGKVNVNGIVSATGPGTVQVKIIREADDKYASAEKIITVTFTKKVAKGNAQAIAESSATWGTPITFTEVDGQEYVVSLHDDGITYEPGTGEVNATQSGDIVIRTNIKPTDTVMRSYWVFTKLTFTTQEQVLNSATPADALWGSKVQLVGSSNKDGIGAYTYIVYPTDSGTAPGAKVDINGFVTAEGPGTVNVKVSRAADDKYAAADEIITVTFTERDLSKMIPDAPTVVGSDTAEWGTDITVTNVNGQEYQFKDNPGSITYSVAGKVSATQPGMFNVRTRVTQENGNSASAWSPYTTVTFTERDLSEIIPDAPVVAGNNTATWGTDIAITEEPGQKYEIKKNSDGFTYNSGVVTATQSGTVKVRTKIYAVEDKNNESKWSEPTELRFTRQIQTITISKPADGPWDNNVQLTVDSNKDDAKGKLIYYIHRKVDALNDKVIVNSSGLVIAKGPGTVVVMVVKIQDLKYKLTSKKIKVKLLRIQRR